MQDDMRVGQQRGRGCAEQSRFRVTLELCQAVYNYFDERLEPEGQIMKSSLVVVGVHARLSNISDEGCYIKDECFTLHGKQVLRKAGQSARDTPGAWVKMRRENPEVRSMLEKLVV